MTAARLILVVMGVAVGAYGAMLLWDNSSTVLVRITLWALAGVVIHDFVFAPLCAAVGLGGRALIPVRWQAPATVAVLCSVVLVVLAIPVYTKPGARPSNPTVVDRDYALGLWIAIAAVWVCVPLYYLLVRRLPVRQDQMVDRQGTDDVERQPPSV